MSVPTPDPVERADATELEEILRDIAAKLASGMKPGWSEVTIEWAALSGAGHLSSCSVVDDRGRSRGASIPPDVNDLCERLRDGMYREGVGTWYTLTFRLSGGGGRTGDGNGHAYDYEASYDYEGRPSELFQPENYARDLRRYPRDDAHLPDWLRAQLRGLPNVYGGIHLEPALPGPPGSGPDSGPDSGSGPGSGSAEPAEPVRTADDGDAHAARPVNLLTAEPVAVPETEVLVPTPREFIEVLRGEGWEVGDGEYRGEFAFSNDWASFQTMSGPRLVRFAGHVDPARWDELEAMFARTGWNVGIDFHGEDGEVSREVLARGSVRGAVGGNLHASGGD